MPTMPLPFSGAAATEAVAVPCSSSWPDVNVWLSRAVVSGRVANSSCERSVPASIIVSGTPGPGGVQRSAPTCDGHHCVPESGSVKTLMNPQRGGGGEAPEAELRGDQLGAGRAERELGGVVATLKLDESPRVPPQPLKRTSPEAIGHDRVPRVGGKRS